MFGSSFTVASTRPISMGSVRPDLDQRLRHHDGRGITGPGYLTKKAPAPSTFTTANTFLGFNIEGGAAVISADNQLGSGSQGVGIANGAALRTGTTFTTGRSLSLYGRRRRLGCYRREHDRDLGASSTASAGSPRPGAGTLILTNVNTHTGGTIVTDGILQISGRSTIWVTPVAFLRCRAAACARPPAYARPQRFEQRRQPRHRQQQRGDHRYSGLVRR